MRQIRKGCFETNSSSMHSLAISKENFENEHFTHEEMLEELRLTDNGEYIMPEDCYFGRSPFRIIHRFSDKVEYAYASMYEKNSSPVLEVLRKLVPEITAIEVPKYAGTDEPYLARFMEDHNISLEEFLTNKKYIVIQDGDEYCYFDSLIDSGLIDTSFIGIRR